MAIKNILITEPANPVLQQLAIQFLRKPEVRLLCFGKGQGCREVQLVQMLLITEQADFQYKDCEEISVDEIWHAVNQADSIEECSEKTKRTLIFANGPQRPVLNYLSASTVAALREEAFTNGLPQCSNGRQIHLLNETAIERSGCKFRFYRLPLTPEILFHPASGWAQFGEALTRFKYEIEDRIPGYFAAQPLRLYLSEEGIIDATRTEDIVQTIQQILDSDMAGSCFHLRTPQPLLPTQCFQILAESAGMSLQIVASHQKQNYVDRLFNSRMEKVLRHLEFSQITAGVVTDTSFAEQVEFSVPSISPQDFIDAYHVRLQSSPGNPGDWKSSFEQKEVLLSEGSILNYYVGGEGRETLVLLNAYGQSFRYWERFIQAVSPQLRIILSTSRGNDSDTIGLKAANPLAVHADDLEKVLRQEKIESCTLLAWCSGPKLALEYYRHYPDRISSMVFVAGSFKGLRQYKELETEYEKNLEPLLEAIEKYPETADVVLEYLKGILLSQSKQARSLDELAAISDSDLQQALSAVNISLQELVLHPFHGENVVAYASQMCDFWKHDFIAGLGKVNVPVLFVGGDCDRIASQPIARIIAGMMPQARYLEIKGGTHYIHYDQWDLLADVTKQMAGPGAKLECSTPWAAMEC